MKKRVLVLGGTRFVGKRLVQLLIDSGAAVTVGTRGRTAVSFSGDVQHVKLDRFDRDSMQSALGRGEWDIVYDQQCYMPEDATITVDILAGRAGRYVLCSTGAVYVNRTGLNTREELFDPLSYPIAFAGRGVDYGEGKRLSEAVLFQRGAFSSVAVRFPIILGPDDYTERLRVQVRRVAQGKPLNVVNPEAKTSLISSGEAAAFLFWLANGEFTGPFNACSLDALAYSDMVKLFESATGQNAIVHHQPDDNAFSVFWAKASFTLSPERAQQCGFRFQITRDWFASLVNQEAALALG